MTETRAQLYTSSWQAPYHSFRRKRQNSFILLPLLSPKSFATLRGPHEVIAFCRKPLAGSLMISAAFAPIIQWKLHFSCAGFASYPFVYLPSRNDFRAIISDRQVLFDRAEKQRSFFYCAEKGGSTKCLFPI